MKKCYLAVLKHVPQRHLIGAVSTGTVLQTQNESVELTVTTVQHAQILIL
jgi:hypothetical protein